MGHLAFSDFVAVAEISKQIRDHEFDQQIEERMALAEKDKDAAIALIKSQLSAELQDKTAKKLSEIHTTGKYHDPLCIMSDIVGGCPEYRVELSKQDLRRVLRFFNDISGKNSKTGLASRDKTKTATIMGAEGGSKLDYRYRTEFFPITSVATTVLINSINIDV